MVDDHADYETGAAPAAHKVSHQGGGTDEISVAGLAGETAQLGAHKILPAIHHAKFTAAEARAAINNIFGSDGKADADIDLDTHKLLNVVDPATDQGGDTKKARNDAISTHAGLATVHQDAPTLIETHRLVAGAHHAKYTDAEARAAFGPISIAPSYFIPHLDTYDFIRDNHFLKNRTSLTIQYFIFGIRFFNGITLTKVTLFGYRDDALAVLKLRLYRVNRVGAVAAMSDISANWVDGYNSIDDTTISLATINNADYSYSFQLDINPNDSVNDVKLSGVRVEFTG